MDTCNAETKCTGRDSNASGRDAGALGAAQGVDSSGEVTEPRRRAVRGFGGGCSGVAAGSRICVNGHPMDGRRLQGGRLRWYCRHCRRAAYVPVPRKSDYERFHAKYEETASGCWEWTGCLNSRGYGCLGRGGKILLAHRWSYEAHVGPIPAGLTIDHLCRNKRCVNPRHLEPVTAAENNRRAREAA